MSNDPQEDIPHDKESPIKHRSVRFQRLQDVMSRSLQEALKRFTLDYMKSCYPGIAKRPDGEATLDEIRLEAIKFWMEGASKETNTVFVERGIEEKLAELEDIILDAVNRSNENGTEISVENKPVEIAQLTPESVVEAHLKPLKSLRMAQLEEELNSLDNENARLENKFTTAVEQIEQLSSTVRLAHERLATVATSVSTEFPTRLKLTHVVDSVID